MDALQVAVGERSEKGPQALRHRDVWRKLLIFLVGKRGQFTAFCTTPNLRYSLHLHGNLHADGFLGLGGGAGDMRRENHILQIEVRRVLQRLLARRRRAPRRRSCPRSSAAASACVVNQLAARAVDDAHALLHRRQRLRR